MYLTQSQLPVHFNRIAVFGFSFLCLLVLGLWTTFAPDNFARTFGGKKDPPRPVAIGLRALGMINLLGATYVLIVRIILGS